MWKSKPAASIVGIEKPPTHRVILMQCFVVVVIAAIVCLVRGHQVALSAILGGLLVVAPNAYFAWRAFQYNQTRSAAHLVGGFVQAEIGKLLITALLFALVFKFVEPLSVEMLFGSYIITLMAGIIASAFMLQKQYKN